jgi:trimethylamine--corrinoid protein Co-methyltransferase
MALRPSLRFLTSEDLAKIHERSMEILENVGVRITHRRALQVLGEAGAQINRSDHRVRFPKNLVEGCLKSVPSKVIYGARDPDHDLIAEVGGPFHTRPMTGGEGYIDLETRQWRKVLTRDLVEWITLADGLENVDYVASIYPDDMALDTRDVHILRHMLEHSVKHLEVQPYTGTGIGFMLEMIKVVQGGAQEVRERPLLSVLTSSLAPLQMLPYALDILFIAGATSPVTLAGVLLLANVELLAGIVIAQSAFPGMPLMYSPRNLIMDSWTGLALMGRVENSMLTACQAQIATELYKMPSNLFGPTGDAMCTDEQAAIEHAFRVALPALSGANVIAGLGHIEHCYTYDPVLLVIDDDLIGMMRRVMRGVEISDETLGAEAIGRVGPGGNFLIDDHTLQYYKTEFYTPKTFNRFVRGVWKGKGSLPCSELARSRAKRILAEHTIPPLDGKMLAELDRIVAAADRAAAEGKLTHAHGGATPDEYGSIGSLISGYLVEEK